MIAASSYVVSTDKDGTEIKKVGQVEVMCSYGEYG